MWNFLKLFSIISLLFVLTGCSISKQVVGEYYLQQKSYDKGSNHFKDELENDKNSASNNYYYARFLLASKKYKESMVYLKNAISIDSKVSEYHSWLGVAFGSLKQYKNERLSYLTALKLDRNNLQALTYLAHNYFDKKEYVTALEYYKKALNKRPENQSSLYYRALTLSKLKRTPEEIIAWKEYLSYYPSGSLARNAVKTLNENGIFEYKNYLIGFKNITLKNITFEPFSSKITYSSGSSLDILGKILEANKKISIHIVSYQLNNKQLAKQKSKSIKKYLLANYKNIDSRRLKLSWFNQAKKFRTNKKQYFLNEDISFITALKK